MRTVAIVAALMAIGWAWAIVGAGCARSEPVPAANAAQKIDVFVSIPPLADLVERIGNGRVTVGILVPPGQSPHAYEPTPRQMTDLGRARVFFAIGWPFERQLLEKLKGANPGLLVVDLRQGIKLRTMTPEEEHADDDAAPADAHAGNHEGTVIPSERSESRNLAVGSAERQQPRPDPSTSLGVTAKEGLPEAAGAGDHPAGEPDPHVWLSPQNLHVMAGTIASALADADRPHAEEYAARLVALQARISEADARVAAALAPLKGKEFFVFHPAFGYFGDAYGLKQVPVEVEGKEPGARQLAAFIQQAKSRGVKVIFVQPQFSARSAEAVAREIGGAVVPMNDLAKDTLGNLEEMAAKVQAALGPEPRPGTTK